MPADAFPTASRSRRPGRLPPWAYGALAGVLTLALLAAVGLSLLGGSGGATGSAEALRGSTSTAGPVGEAGAVGGTRSSSGAGEGGAGGSTGDGEGARSGEGGASGESGSSGSGGSSGATSGSQSGDPSTGTTAAAGGSEGGEGSTATTAPGSGPTATTVAATAPDEPDPSVTEAFAQAFEARCREIWSLSTSGELFDPEDKSTPYVVEDCLDQADPDLALSFDNEQDGARAGRDEAEFAAYLLSGSGQLCYAGECWTYE